MYKSAEELPLSIGREQRGNYLKTWSIRSRELAANFFEEPTREMSMLVNKNGLARQRIPRCGT